MPWPTNPSEEYFGRGLWGWVTSAWVKLLATAGGALHVYVKGGDSAILVKQQQAALFTPGIHGYDGAVWRKLSLLWGYSDRYAEKQSNLNCTAGTNVLTFATVPAGEVWKVTALTWTNIDKAVSVIDVALYDGTNAFTIYVEGSPAANVYKSVLVDVTLKAGDRVRVGFYGCNLNDDIYAWAIGSKMAVA